MMETNDASSHLHSASAAIIFILISVTVHSCQNLKKKKILLRLDTKVRRAVRKAGVQVIMNNRYVPVLPETDW